MPEGSLGVHPLVMSLLLYTGKKWLSIPSGDQAEKAGEGIEELYYKHSPSFFHLVKIIEFRPRLN